MSRIFIFDTDPQINSARESNVTNGRNSSHITQKGSLTMWAAGKLCIVQPKNEPEYLRDNQKETYEKGMVFFSIFPLDAPARNYHILSNLQEFSQKIKRWKTTKTAGKFWIELATLAEEMRRRGKMRRCKLTHCFLLSPCAGLVL